MQKLTPGIVAEFVGTFGLMFVGGAAIINTGGENLIAIALAHGLILAVCISAVMHISGGQLNPAVSIGLAATGKQKWDRCIAFIIAQVAGSVLAAMILKMTFAPEAVETVRLGATLGGSTNVMTIVILEIIATFFLMFVILGTAVDPRGVGKNAAVGGFAIGLTVAAMILAIGPITGASMNPARSFGPALIGEHWDLHMWYWIAPIIGALIASFTWKFAMEDRSSEKSG
jgi:aquaporin Z